MHGLWGLSKTVGIEGLKSNILCNVIAHLGAAFVPPINLDLTASLAAILAHSSNTSETGSLFTVDGNRVAKLRW